MKFLKIFKQFNQIFSLFDKDGKKKYKLLLLLILFTTVVEMLGVGAISPLMSLAMNPTEAVKTSSVMSRLSIFTGFTGNNLVYCFGLIYVGIIIFKNILSLFTFVRTSHFSSHLNKSFGIKLMQNYLSKDYSWFLKRNSSDFPRLIIQETKILTRHIIHKSLIVFVNIFLIIGMVLIIAVQNIKIAVIAMVSLALIFGAIHLFVRIRLKILGKKRFEMDKMKFKILSDTFGGIKEVKVYGCEKYYVDNYYKLTDDFANNTVMTDTYSNLTKYIVETMFFTFFGLLIMFLVYVNKDIASIMPSLSLYLLAAYKIMPALQKVSAAINSIMSYAETYRKLKKDIKEEVFLEDNTDLKKLDFTSSISLKNITFKYDGKEESVLNGVDVNIKHCEKVGIVGGSGSGKTTMLNLILGLFTPNEGSICIDDIPLEGKNIIAWRKNIGLVSQDIFLFDGTIAENIAFTMDSESIIHEQLIESAKHAEMFDFIDNLPDGFNTNVGDRGVQISGGQAQRIAIARALYRNPQLLILDEATSAMDNLTESAIMNSIEKLTGKKTIIIVAHRLSTVKTCDRILFMKNGNIVDEGTYEELKTSNDDFKKLTMDIKDDGENNA